MFCFEEIIFFDLAGLFLFTRSSLFSKPIILIPHFFAAVAIWVKLKFFLDSKYDFLSE
jgi:hypothetical protein